MKVRKFILLLLPLAAICFVCSCGGGDGTPADGSGTGDTGGSDSGTSSSTTPLLATAISARDADNLAVGRDGTVWAWGDSILCAFGNSYICDTGPGQVVGPDFNGLLTNVIKVCGGTDGQSFAITADGIVWAWGANTDYQLGDGTSDDRYSPVKIEGVTDVIAVACGGAGGILKSDGTAWMWGPNRYGQVGDGTTTDRSSPVQMHGPNDEGYMTDLLVLAAANYHTVALKADGTVWAWGSNNSGQLGNGILHRVFGDGIPSYYTTPIQVHGPNDEGFLTGIKSVNVGRAVSFGASGPLNFTIALREDGTVWAWGLNDSGQLGDGTTETRLTPVQVLDSDGDGYLTDVSYISAGTAHSLAVKTDGTVWAWGRNDYGQVGVESERQNVFLPTRVIGIENVDSVDGGYRHTIALKSDGTIWTWGSNFYGTVELGGETPGGGKSSPVQVMVAE